MYLQVVSGLYNKKFVKVCDVKSKEDFELYEIIKKTVSRSEYFPFIKSFNKNVSESYMLQEYLFPAQFLFDVKERIKNFTNKYPIVENEDILFNPIEREEFDEWINSLKFPEKIDTQSEDYKFQRDSVFFALNYKSSKVDISMSGGKTFISYLFIRYLFDNYYDQDAKFIIIVPSKLLAKQLFNDFNEFNTYFERKIIVESIFSGAQKILDADVVCGTYHSLSEYEKEYFSDFKAVLCDELHRAKAYSIRDEIWSKTQAEFYFGMTGTMPDYKSLDYIHLTLMFGPTVLVKETWELIDSGVACDIIIYQILVYYLDDEMKNLSYNLLGDGIKGTEKFYEEKFILQRYDKRTALIGKLLSNYIENSLILVNTVEYCQILYTFLTEYCNDKWKFYIIHGKIKDDERVKILDQMKNSLNYNCVIGTYGTMSTGISIPSLTNGYLCDGGKAKTRVGQGLGRFLRLFKTKKIARLFDIQDMIMKSTFKNHAKVRNDIYKEKKLRTEEIKVEI